MLALHIAAITLNLVCLVLSICFDLVMHELADLCGSRELVEVSEFSSLVPHRSPRTGRAHVLRGWTQENAWCETRSGDYFSCNLHFFIWE